MHNYKATPNFSDDELKKKLILCLGKYGIPSFPIETSGDGDIFIIPCQDVYCANDRCRLKNKVQYYIKVSKNL